MEILAIAVIVAVVFALFVANFFFFGKVKLAKPVPSCSDQELVRRLSRYKKLWSSQIVADQWAEAAATEVQLNEIRNEIFKREHSSQIKQAKSLKRTSLFSENADGLVISDKALAGADAGDIDLQVLVGTAYLSGANGLPQNPIKAAMYLVKAAEHGHPFASFVVAGLFADGLGVIQNFDTARSWAIKAKDLGAPDAAEMLAMIDAKRKW